MKYLCLMLAAALLAVTATYNNTVSGSQTAAPEAEGIAINLTAAGDLPGMVRLTLLRTETNVSGGSLRLTVLPANADASSNDRGTLTGSVTSGTVTLDSNGTVASAADVQVAISGGTGDFSSVTSGTATINISAGAENPSQLSGTLVLNF